MAQIPIYKCCGHCKYGLQPQKEWKAPDGWLVCTWADQNRLIMPKSMSMRRMMMKPNHGSDCPTYEVKYVQQEIHGLGPSST